LAIDSTIDIDFYYISTWPMPNAHQRFALVRNSFLWKLKLQQCVMNGLYQNHGIEALLPVRPFVSG
jgi:hypothetical protein